MNIANLFEVQRKLDAEIEKNHPVQQGEDRLAKRILALQVELGELANEWRGFKFWSNNQEPRTSEWQPFTNHMRGEGGMVKNPLLEEYVDCLHFILSIGLQSGLSNQNLILKPFRQRTIERQFIEIGSYIVKFYFSSNKGDYQSLLSAFISLGKMLGFTREKIESAYMSKNQTNWERQGNGY